MTCNHSTGCGCCGGSGSVTRRSFLTTGCATGAVALTGVALPWTQSAYGDGGANKMTVRVMFALHAPVQPGPDWPNVGFDFNPVMEKTLQALGTGCAGIVFVPSLATGPEQAREILEEDAKNGNIDGYIVMQMNCWNQVVQPAVDTGKPVLYCDFLYGGSGGFLVYTAGLIRAERKNFGFISSSRVEDVVAAARCFPKAKANGADCFAEAVTAVRKGCTPDAGDLSCLSDSLDCLSTEELREKLKGMKMIEVEQGWHNVGEALKESLGIEIVRIPFAELNEAWLVANEAEAGKIVKNWKENAVAILDVPEEVLNASAKMYLAKKACMERHGAQAITINCLGGFYGGHIHAYPCLGHHELLNEGLVGACECDTLSTLTMLVLTTMTKGRPGYISDPVMDCSKREIIYAHCVAGNKPFGPQGESCPYAIMTHSEDRQGASVRSILPEGYMTTTVTLNPQKKEVLFHQAKSVGNSLEDRACRTKLVGIPVGDYEKLYTNWDGWGWHRVTYYGDLKKPVFDLANALGWTVIEEA